MGLDFSTPRRDVACADRRLSTHRIARAAVDFRLGLRLPVLADVFALRGRSDSGSWSDYWFCAGGDPIAQVHADPPGRIGSRPGAPNTAMRAHPLGNNRVSSLI